MYIGWEASFNIFLLQRICTQRKKDPTDTFLVRSGWHFQLKLHLWQEQVIKAQVAQDTAGHQSRAKTDARSNFLLIAPLTMHCLNSPSTPSSPSIPLNPTHPHPTPLPQPPLYPLESPPTLLPALLNLYWVHQGLICRNNVSCINHLFLHHTRLLHRLPIQIKILYRQYNMIQMLHIFYTNFIQI